MASDGIGPGSSSLPILRGPVSSLLRPSPYRPPSRPRRVARPLPALARPGPSTSTQTPTNPVLGRLPRPRLPQIGGLTHGGPVALKHTVLSPHPVAAIQRSHFKNELDGALFIAERVYGAHAAWQMKLDRALVRRARGAWRAVWRRRD